MRSLLITSLAAIFLLGSTNLSFAQTSIEVPAKKPRQSHWHKKTKAVKKERKRVKKQTINFSPEVIELGKIKLGEKPLFTKPELARFQKLLG